MRKLGTLMLAAAACAAFGTAASPAAANTITPSCSPAPADCSGPWYTSDVTLDWTVDPAPLDPPTGCGESIVGETPIAGTTFTCSADWADGSPLSDSQSVTLKVDETLPTISGATTNAAANGAGWFNAPLNFDFAGTDTLSGISSCSQNVSYSGPDSATASVNGSCTDVAGNVKNGSHSFKYDATAPSTTTATPGRAPNGAGWYKAPITFTFTGSDATSGVPDPCDTKTYSGPDTSGTTVSAFCTDNAGNADPTPLSSPTIKYDATAPTTDTATPDRAPNGAGWYKAPVTFSFHGSDGTSGVPDPCDTKIYSGPDTTGTTVSAACSDNAGNTDATPLSSPTIKYDATAPTVTVSPGRAADLNGWYNHAVTFTSSGNANDTSGIASCDTPVTYSTPDTSGTSVTGHCTDGAGNTGSASSGTFKFDATPPSTDAATPDRSPNGAGWYKAPVTFTFTGSDATSGVPATCASKIYSGPDTSGTTVSASCTDNAGNADPTPLSSSTIKYDATPPTVTGATPSAQPNANGWFRQPVNFDFTGADTTSGIASCSQNVPYSSGDGAGVAVHGTCSDNAGNTSAIGTHLLNFDATPPDTTGANPSRAADSNGWFNHSVSFHFTGTDATSGIDSAACDTVPYNSPDSADATVSGVCKDLAGNVDASPFTFHFKYDSAPPSTLSGAVTRPPDSNGWYNHPLPIDFHGADTLSGVDPVGPCDTETYSGASSTTASIVGKCHDLAGNVDPVGVSSPTFQYDATAPVATAAVPDRPADSNGWFNHPVGFNFDATDDLSGLAGCSAAGYSGPDSAAAAVTASCGDNAGNTSSTPFGLRYDSTPPVVMGAVPDRLPDFGDWYNHPVKLSFKGRDALSGIAGCSTYTFNGAPSDRAAVAGACQDNAGNVAAATFTMHYDATPPAAAQVQAAPGDHRIFLSWTKPGDAVKVVVSRSIGGKASAAAKAIYSGKGSTFVDHHLHNGTKYTYTVTDFDQANNTSTATAVVAPTSLSLRPLPGAVTSTPPLLTWKRVRRADYYNLQLYLGQTKVLSVWPRKASFQMQQSWIFAGRSFSLIPGTYRWYVWPGYGARRANHYGHMIGKSSFTFSG